MYKTIFFYILSGVMCTAASMHCITVQLEMIEVFESGTDNETRNGPHSSIVLSPEKKRKKGKNQR